MGKRRCAVERLEQRALLTAFPGAEGFGANVTGGRGGTVYHVTNLNDSGAGSFRDAVSVSGRTVVFDIGGVITINSQVAFASNITIAGQTAPGGIAVSGDGVSLSNRNNIIVRYMTFRQGIDSGDGDKALNITNGFNIILDHVTIGWGRWDNLGITSNAHDITVQDSLIHEGIDPQRFGSLIDSSTNLTLARNLFINNQSRNPKGKADMQFINNVIYNWRYAGYVGGHSSADWNQDLINNYFIKGRSSENDEFVTDFAATDKVYHSGNWVDLDKVDTGGDGLPEGRLVTSSDFTSNGATVMASSFNVPPVPVTVMSAIDAYQWVRDHAGNSLHRDAADLRQIQHLTSLGSQGAIIATEATVGGQPPIAGGIAAPDSDGDGMPNAYESANGTNPNVADHNGDVNADGYTNLENYINAIGGPPPAGSPTVANGPTATAPGTGPTSSLSVLGADDEGEGNLTYTWTASGPGTVNFSANGTNAAKSATATFNRAGTYAVAVTVIDSDGFSTLGSVYVTVNQALTSVNVTPATATTTPYSQRQFTAQALDQFAQPMTTQPTFTWSVISGAGSISSSGIYTAGSTTGSATIRAASGAMSDTSPITINAGAAVLQSEWAFVDATSIIESTNAGFNGTAYINYPTSGGYVLFDNVPGGVGGATTIRFRYALGSGTRTGTLYVNGVAQPITFNATGSFTTWLLQTVNVTLKPGQINAIRLDSTGQDLANIDELQVDVPTTIPSTHNGTAAVDQYYLKRNGANLDIWIGGNGTGTPTYSIAQSAAPALTFNGNGGNDVLTVDGSAGSALPSGGITFNASDGADVLNLIGTSALDSASFSATQIALNGTVIAHSNLEKRSYVTGGGLDNVSVSGSSMSFDSSQRLGQLLLSSSGSATVAAGGANLLILNTLGIDGTSKLDLNDNDLVVNNGSFSTIRELVLSGFGTSSGITSSTSNGSQILALFDNALVGAGDWMGVPIGANAIVGKYTFFGDANIDGQVSGDDYTVIDANLNTAPAVGMEWLSGDMNLDGSVTGDDYTVIDANLGLGNGNPLSAPSFHPGLIPLSLRRDAAELLS